MADIHMIDISSEEILGTEPFVIRDSPSNFTRIPEKRYSLVSCVLHPDYNKHRHSKFVYPANSISKQGIGFYLGTQSQIQSNGQRKSDLYVLASPLKFEFK